MFIGLDVDEVFTSKREVNAIGAAGNARLTHVASVTARGGMIDNGDKQQGFVAKLDGAGVVDLRRAGIIFQTDERILRMALQDGCGVAARICIHSKTTIF